MPPKGLAVEFDHKEMRFWSAGRMDARITWDDLEQVLIETTDDGPFAEDFFWVLVGPDGPFRIPDEANGAKELLARLQDLPGFDNEAVIRASMSVVNDLFLCWQRPPGGG